MRSNTLRNRFKVMDTSNVKMYKKDILNDSFKEFYINGEILNTKVF